MAKHFRYFKLVLSVVIGLCVVGPTLAQPQSANTSINHYGEKEEGWFWYKDPRDEKPKEPPPPKPKAEPEKPKKPEQFSVEWLREQYPKLRDRAIEDPSDDNVRAFLYAQRIIMDKAQNFANAAQKVAGMDPLLDENNRIPIASAAKATVVRYADAAREKALRHVATVAGLWFFFDSACDFCSAQHNYMSRLKSQYNFIIKNISVDGKGLSGMGADYVRDRGQAKLLSLQVMPTTVLVVPPNGFYIVSQGLNSTEGLADKILMAAEANNLVPKKLQSSRHPYERGVLKPEDLKGQPLSDDPKEWVRYLQEKIGGRIKSE